MTLPRVRPREILFWATLLVAAVLFVQSLIGQQSVNRDWRHVDEVYWMGEGYHFSLFFVERDFEHPTWTEYWAIRNPPLVKYIYGLALAVADHPVTDASLRRVYETHWRDGETLWANTPAEVLRVCRTTASVFGVLTAGLVFAIGTVVANRWLGVLALLVLARDGLLMRFFYSAMSEPIVICLLCLFVLACLRFYRRDRVARQDRRGWLLAVLAVSVSIGLLALAKPNGPLAGIAFAIVAVTFWGYRTFVRVRGGSPRREEIRRGLSDGITNVVAVGLLSMALMVAFNPYLHTRHGQRLAQTAAAWKTHISTQQERHATDRLDDVGERLLFLADQGFPTATAPGEVRGPGAVKGMRLANAGILFIGVLVLIRTGRPRTGRRQLLSPEWVFLLTLSVYAGALLLWLPLAWTRYALVLHPFTIVLQAACAWFVLGVGMRTARRVLPFLPDPGPIRTWTGNDREAPEGVSG